jgi:hypothetical protein
VVEPQPSAHCPQSCGPSDGTPGKFSRADASCGRWRPNTERGIGATKDGPVKTKIVGHHDLVAEQALDVASDIDERRGEIERSLVQSMEPGRAWSGLGVDEGLVRALEGTRRVQQERSELDDPAPLPQARCLQVEDEVLDTPTRDMATPHVG